MARSITPEDELIEHELRSIIDEHYGKFDAQVALGYLDRKAAAKKLKINYPAYCKRLQRKFDSFLPVLSGTGYL